MPLSTERSGVPTTRPETGSPVWVSGQEVIFKCYVVVFMRLIYLVWVTMKMEP